MNKVVVTCEHGGNQVPEAFRKLFEGNKDVLATHRGYDIGSKQAFEGFSKIADYTMINEMSRLLIEINRSLHHPLLFSEFSKNLSDPLKEDLKNQIYLTFRNEVENTIGNLIHQKHTVIHLSIHTFTPKLNGKVRTTDIGLLYDPARHEEKAFCYKWKKNMRTRFSEYKTRLNYPYLGKTDGFATYLRKHFPEKYMGIEVEINQKHADQITPYSNALIETFPQKN